jgi:hypothetical protein
LYLWKPSEKGFNKYIDFFADKRKFSRLSHSLVQKTCVCLSASMVQVLFPYIYGECLNSGRDCISFVPFLFAFLDSRARLTSFVPFLSALPASRTRLDALLLVLRNSKPLPLNLSTRSKRKELPKEPFIHMFPQKL